MGIKNFLKASVCSFPSDIERPFHKKINFVLKTISVVFAFIGLFLLLKAGLVYWQARNLADGAEGLILMDTAVLALLGIGVISISIFLALILVIRYIAFTLADKIYLRCFSSEEEKQQKKRF